MSRDEKKIIATPKKDHLLVAVWGFYEELLWNNFLFHNENAPIGDNLLKPLNALYRQGKKRNIDFVTLDMVDRLEDVDLYIFLDVPKNDSPIAKRAFEDSYKQKWLIMCESLIVKPESLDPLTVSRFDKVFTYLDSIIDNKKFFALRYAFELPRNIAATLPARTRLCVMIAGAKSNNHGLSLYNERLKAIRWFEQHHPEGFSLYGLGWNPLVFPSYKGVIGSKSDVLQHYKFSICYENARDIPGYITEKIFDCLFAGCIPIYRGADNICDHVPKECFIDLRDFSSYESLYSYISAMPEDIYNAYINNIRLYLRSSKSFQYSITNYCNTIIEHCLPLIPRDTLKTKTSADNQVKISICIPTYNRVAYLKEAIESALLQSYSNIEVIVSDNASTDGTFELCKQYESDPRFRYYRNPSNIGGISNTEKCVYGLATGDYTLILSDDDYLYDPGYLSKVARLIHEYGESVLLVFADYVRYSEESECITDISDFNLKPVINGFELFYKWWLPLEGYPVWVPLLTAVFNRKKAIELNAFKTPEIMAVDTILWWKLCLSGDVGFVNSRAAVYRVHGASDSTTADFARYSNNIRMFILPARFALDCGYDLQDIRKWKWRIALSFIMNAVGLDPVREKFKESCVIERLTELYRIALQTNLSREEEEQREDEIIGEAIRFMGGALYISSVPAEPALDSEAGSQTCTPIMESAISATTNETIIPLKVEPLSILFVVHNFPPTTYGGVEVYTHNLALKMVSMGQRVTVLYPEVTTTEPLYSITRSDAEGFTVARIRVRAGNLVGSVCLPEMDKAFENFITANRFDIVHFQHTYIHLSMTMIRVACKAGLRVAVTLHDFWYICHRTHLFIDSTRSVCTGPETVAKCTTCPNPWIQNPQEYLPQIEQFVTGRHATVHSLLNDVDLIFAPSRFVADVFQRHGYGVGKITVAPLGLRPIQIQCSAPSNVVRFGYLGNSNPLKNIQTLVDAFSATAGPATLDLFGGGESPRDYNLTIRTHDPRITYHGLYTIEQLPSILSGIDVLVVPSFIESYCLTVREALIAGIPVIAAAAGGIVDIVQDGVNGFLFNPRNANELTHLMQQIIQNPGLLCGLNPSAVPVRTITEDADFLLQQYCSTSRGVAKPISSPAASRYTTPIDTVATVSIIIPVFNQVAFTRQCLEALYDTLPPSMNCEIIIVNNGSGDGTAEYLASQGDRITVISNLDNPGFAVACNQGARNACGTLVLFLNNDTVPRSGWLESLLVPIDNGEADICGARLLYPDGRCQHAGIAFDERGLGYHIFANFPGDAAPVKERRYMQAVTGACLVLRKSLFLEFGGFDEGFRNGFEDVDFCLRAGEKGMRILYVPESVLVHYAEQSSGRKDNDLPNIQRFFARWHGKVRQDDKELYARFGLAVRKEPDGRIIVTPAVKSAVAVSIIIPLYNQVEMTRACLKALERNTPSGSYELVLVDNGSSDATADLLATYENEATVIHNVQNRGFAAACNQGARAAKGNYLLFLNNDTEPGAEWLEPLLDVFRTKENVGIVGNKLLYPDGTIQHAGVMIVRDDVLNIPISPCHREYRWDNAVVSYQLQQISAVTAACMMVTKPVFEAVGGFDESYWNGYEDVDLCFKVQKAGFAIYFQPASVVIHHESKSGRERRLREHDNLRLLQERWQKRITPDLIRLTDKVIRYDFASIIILTYNSENTILRCLDSVRSFVRQYDEVIIVDNGSKDSTTAIVEHFISGVPQFRLIKNGRNLGFSAGTNVGISNSSNPYVVLLNPDTVVTSGWLDNLYAHFYLSGPTTGAVGPISNYVAGLQKMELYQQEPIPAHATIESAATSFTLWNKGKRVESKLLIGFCMMIRRTALNELGMLDEHLFLGNDDLELSWRLRANGYHLFVAADTFVYHEGQQSFNTEPSALTMRLVQESTDALYRKLVEHYGADNVPMPVELWGIEWFTPTAPLFNNASRLMDLKIIPGSNSEDAAAWNGNASMSTPSAATDAVCPVVKEVGNVRYPLIPLVGHSSSSILQKLSSSQRLKGVLKRYTTEN